jgi:flagellum-specific peptidoglycan hydrolase FlgJ
MADINNFVSSNLQAAQLAAAQLGTDPAHVLGQWGLETGWGKSVIPGSNNLGNIKSTNGQGISAVDNQLKTTSKYAAYETPAEGAQAYADLLQRSRYRSVQGTSGDPASFANGLVKGGYAEDPASFKARFRW